MEESGILEKLFESKGSILIDKQVSTSERVEYLKSHIRNIVEEYCKNLDSELIIKEVSKFVNVLLKEQEVSKILVVRDRIDFEFCVESEIGILEPGSSWSFRLTESIFKSRVSFNSEGNTYLAKLNLIFLEEQ